MSSHLMHLTSLGPTSSKFGIFRTSWLTKCELIITLHPNIKPFQNGTKTNKQIKCPSMGLGPTHMATFVYHDSGGDFPVRYSKEVLLIYRFSQA